jgi:hypothetical protein
MRSLDLFAGVGPHLAIQIFQRLGKGRFCTSRFLEQVAVGKNTVAGDIGGACSTLPQSMQNRNLPRTMDLPIRIGREGDKVWC